MTRQSGIFFLISWWLTAAAIAAEPATIGGGKIDDPARGPLPFEKVAGAGFVLVKNWDFGTGPANTIHDIDQFSEHFQYHDQFGTIGNGTNYGAVIVSPDEKHALAGRHQPIEGKDTGGKPARQFTTDALRTFLVPLNNAATVEPGKHNIGCGSFQAIWKLPRAGSLLGQDVLWETRVRMITPAYFWFAIWTAGNKWQQGAEIDVVESFGYDNGKAFQNFDGRFWHTNSVGGKDRYSYEAWDKAMTARGVKSFRAEDWHVWSLLYRADDSFSVYMDGAEVQMGNTPWRLGAKADGEPLDMSLIFDGGWGHTQVGSVNHPLPSAAFVGKYCDWDYSRVYLRQR